MDSLLIIDEISMDIRCGILISNQWRIDEDVSIGNDFCTRKLPYNWTKSKFSLSFVLLFYYFFDSFFSKLTFIISSLFKFTRVSCCFIFVNHTQNHLESHQLFLIRLLENTSHMQCRQTLLTIHTLSTRKNWVAQFIYVCLYFICHQS